MRNGICSKCGSDRVYTGEQVSNKNGHQKSNTIPTSFFRTARLDNYVCGNCGYVESYIANEHDLDRIEEQWPRVTPKKER